jgi:hypothetical protein
MLHTRRSAACNIYPGLTSGPAGASVVFNRKTLGQRGWYAKDRAFPSGFIGGEGSFFTI